MGSEMCIRDSPHSLLPLPSRLPTRIPPSLFPFCSSAPSPSPTLLSIPPSSPAPVPVSPLFSVSLLPLPSLSPPPLFPFCSSASSHSLVPVSSLFPFLSPSPSLLPPLSPLHTHSSAPVSSLLLLPAPPPLLYFPSILSLICLPPTPPSPFSLPLSPPPSHSPFLSCFCLLPPSLSRFYPCFFPLFPVSCLFLSFVFLPPPPTCHPHAHATPPLLRRKCMLTHRKQNETGEKRSGFLLRRTLLPECRGKTAAKREGTRHGSEAGPGGGQQSRIRGASAHAPPAPTARRERPPAQC